jgi:peptidoglycan/xylan/chitin deacetylase (PgdA/CDA1 family)
MINDWLPAATFAAAFLTLQSPALAQDANKTCGPEALGTSRVEKVGTQGGLAVGWKTYPETLPLADHEVILTFDDGPDPVLTPQALDALKAQCVRATFFDIGAKVDKAPQIARREVEEGHNVAFHTYSHPQPTMRFMAPAVSRADILKGVIAVERAAYGQTFPNGEPDDLSKLKLHAPFFRYTGFANTVDLDNWFASNGVAVFSVDLWASDWIPMTPDQELKLALSRLEKAKKGMFILHDDKPWTVAMLPRFLAELKKRGYRIVQIEAGQGHGPTEKAPAGWRSETGRIVDSIRPRFDKAAAKPATSFNVKPAPLE